MENEVQKNANFFHAIFFKWIARSFYAKNQVRGLSRGILFHRPEKRLKDSRDKRNDFVCLCLFDVATFPSQVTQVTITIRT